MKWHCLIPICVGERDGVGTRILVGGFKLDRLLFDVLNFLGWVGSLQTENIQCHLKRKLDF